MERNAICFMQIMLLQIDSELATRHTGKSMH